MKVTVIVGGPKGPILHVHTSLTASVRTEEGRYVGMELERDIQLLHTSVLSQQPAEAIEVLEDIGQGVHSAQEVLDAIMQMHNSNLPPPRIDIASLAVLSAPEPAVINTCPDKIPVPQGYKRNRFQK